MSHPFASTCGFPCACRMFVIFVSLWVRADALLQKLGWMTQPAEKSGEVGGSSEPRSFGASLLSEIAKKKTEPLGVLPDVSSPGTAFQTLNAHLHKMHTELHAMQQVDSAALAKQKDEYEQKLATQQSEIVKGQALNAQMANATGEIRKVNLALRKKASMFAGANQKLRLELVHLQKNITYAMEFLDQALNVSEIMSNATEVSVVTELDAQDQMMQQRWTHKKLVSSIGMLQIDNQIDSKKDLTSSLAMDGMIGSFEDYKKQKAAREYNLKMAFQSRFLVGSQRMDLVRDEYKKLRKAHESEKQLQGRLIVAVQYLEKIHERLLRWRLSLLEYFQDLGDRQPADSINVDQKQNQPQSRTAVH